MVASKAPFWLYDTGIESFTLDMQEKFMKRCLLLAAMLLSAGMPAAMAQPSPAEIIANNDKNGDKAIDRAEWAASPAPFPFPEEADTNTDPENSSTSGGEGIWADGKGAVYVAEVGQKAVLKYVKR